MCTLSDHVFHLSAASYCCCVILLLCHIAAVSYCCCVILLLVTSIYIQEVRKGTFHLTPLGEAALGRQLEVVNLLLANGADFTFKAGVSSQQVMAVL